MLIASEKQLTWVGGAGGADGPGVVPAVGRLVGAVLQAEVALLLQILLVVDHQTVVVATVVDGVVLPYDAVQLQ